MKRHPSQAVLRRLLDEPEAVPERDRQHAASCGRCGQASQALAAAAALAAASLAAASLAAAEPDPETLPAFRRLRQGEYSVVPARPGVLERLRDATTFNQARTRVLRLGAVGTTVALLLGTLVATGAAGNLIKIFEPDTFVAVPIDITSLGSLPDLGGFGSIRVLQEPSVTMTDSLAAAATASGMHLLATGALPGSVKGQPHYVVVGSGSASFTFDAQAASGTASRLGKPLPAIPAGLDGAVLTLDGGPLVVEAVGSQPGLGGLLPAQRAGGPSGTPGLHQAPGSKPGSGPESGLGHGLGFLSDLGGIPQLVIVQMKAPVLYSDHLSVAQYEDALLSMPGVPPSLAAQIRSLGDLSSMLPIPIPSNLASSHAADINGAPGLVIGDTTGIASGVIWQRNGQVYAVIGSLTDAQVVAIARGMH